MKRLLVYILVLMAASVCNAASTQADFYLSPNGSDAWSGTLSNPNAQGTDGPFATLERARDAVRDLKKSKSTDIVVLVREETYQLDKTVVFGLEDSGVGDWKLLMTEDAKRVELHNLKTDRAEEAGKDLSKAYPEIVARLTKMTLDWKVTLPAKVDPNCVSPKRGED